MATIHFKVANLTIQLPQGIELYRAWQLYPQIPLKFGCRNGECGVCVMRVIAGGDKLNKMGDLERKTLAKKNHHGSYRLACQCALNGDLTVE